MVATKFGLPRPAFSIIRSAWLDASLVSESLSSNGLSLANLA
jgi:hypothetical protein